MIRLPAFEKQYRVLEVREDGVTTFFPQEQHLYFFWKKLIQDGYEYLKEEFETLEEAEAFLFNYQQTQTEREKISDAKQREKKLNKAKGHPFNAVFYKLKKTDNE